jgi:leucyl aminopeptidase (aminopeptidase T)
MSQDRHRTQAQIRRFTGPYGVDVRFCAEQHGWHHPATEGVLLGILREMVGKHVYVAPTSAQTWGVYLGVEVLAEGDSPLMAIVAALETA